MQTQKKYFGHCQTALDYFSRGNFKILIEDYAGAIDDFSHSIEIHPVFWGAYYQRGNVFSLLQKKSEAIPDFDKAVNLILKYY